MRQIGSISETRQASRFGAFLATEGISCSIDETPSGHLIWVHDEDRVAQAKEELVRFQQEPEHERYRDAQELAKQAATERQNKNAAIRSRTIDLRTRWVRPSLDQCPVTFALMALMVFIAVMLWSDPSRREVFVSRMVFSPDQTTNAIRNGEVWRLISPILVHEDRFHLLFNLLVLYGFGLKVESQLRPPRFFLLVLAIALVSNYIQFLAAGGRFYGMSGVNYGIFGYAWIRSRMDANSGIFVTRESVVMMLAFAIMCVVFIPGIANWAHGAGLATGAAVGAASAFVARPRHS